MTGDRMLTGKPLSPSAWRMAGFILLVLAAKLLLIAAYGLPFPISDQWTEEGYALLAPWVRGQLGWQELFSSHWEHRFVLTRLLDIAMLEANGGIWNPVLQMVVNAGLHVAGLLLLLSRVQAGRPRSPLLMLAATLLFCLPYAFENTLVSFQSQVYFLLIFSMLFLRGISSPAFTGRWLLGLLWGGAAFFSLGSGAATLAAGAAFMLLRQWRGGSPDRRGKTAILLVAGLAAVAVWLTLRTPSPAWLRADSAQTFATALVAMLGWPLPPILAPLVCFPLLRFMLRQLRQAPAADHPSWSLFALGLWLLAQLAALAYGRGQAPLSSRYTDFFAIGLLLNFACLPGVLTLQDHSVPQRWRLPALLWTGLVVAGLLLQTGASLNAIRTYAVPEVAASGAHIAAYLQTGDPGFLAHSGIVQPGANPASEASLQAQVRAMLDAPGMRQILPPELVPENRGRQPGPIRWLLAHLGETGGVLLLAGALALVLALLAGHGRGPAPPACK